MSDAHRGAESDTVVCAGGRSMPALGGFESCSDA